MPSVESAVLFTAVAGVTAASAFAGGLVDADGCVSRKNPPTASKTSTATPEPRRFDRRGGGVSCVVGSRGVRPRTESMLGIVVQSYHVATGTTQTGE